MRPQCSVFAAMVILPPSLAFAAERYDCDFDGFCFLDLECAESRVCLSEQKCERVSDFSFRLVHEEGKPTAMLVGNNGSSELHVIDGYAGKTFVEVLPAGTVHTLTMHDSGQAVYSRHTINVMGQEIVPSQYYGECRISG